jgi:O-antigen/teichoic acid export membrane protein
MVMLLVTQSLSLGWLLMFFELARNGKENRSAAGPHLLGIGLFLVALAGLGILLSPSFVHVALAYRYRAATRIVLLVVLGYLLDALFSLFRLSRLRAKRTAFVFMISLMAFSANLVLNFAIIPRWRIYGVARATAIAHGVEASRSFTWHRASSRYPIDA